MWQATVLCSSFGWCVPGFASWPSCNTASKQTHQSSPWNINWPQTILSQILNGQWLASLCQSLLLDFPRCLPFPSPQLCLQVMKHMRFHGDHIHITSALVLLHRHIMLTLARKPPKWAPMLDSTFFFLASSSALFLASSSSFLCLSS